MLAMPITGKGLLHSSLWRVQILFAYFHLSISIHSFINLPILHPFICVERRGALSEWSIEWKWVVNTGTIIVLEPLGNDKAINEWGSGEMATLPLEVQEGVSDQYLQRLATAAFSSRMITSRDILLGLAIPPTACPVLYLINILRFRLSR